MMASGSFLLLLSFVSLLVACQAYRLGVLTDFTSQRGRRFLTLVRLGVQDVASEMDIELVVNNTNLKANYAAFATAWQIQHGNILGTIGPLTTLETAPVGQLGSAYEIPVFGPAAGSEFSDKIGYPYFFRARPDDSDYFYPLAAFVQQFGFAEIGVLTTTDTFGNGLLGVLLVPPVPLGFKVSTARFVPFPDANTAADCRRALQSLLAKGIRIIVIHSGAANLLTILNTAIELGVANNPEYQLIATAELATAFPTTVGVTASALRGMIGLPLVLPLGNTKYLELWNRSLIMGPNEGYDLAPPNNAELLGYDAVWGFVRAIQALQSNSQPITSQNIATTLRTLVYEGVTGTIKFTTQQNRDYPYSVVNWQGGLQPVIIGSYDKSNGVALTAPIMWGGGSSHRVWDGFSLRDGQELQTSPNAALLTLSFFVSILAGWCALILLEQAVHAATHQGNPWVWTLFSGIVFGSCGIWGCVIISIGAISLERLGAPSLHPGWTMATLAISIVCATLAYGLGVYGVRRMHEAKQSTVVVVHSEASTSDTPTPPQPKERAETTDNPVAQTAWAQLKALPRAMNRWLFLGCCVMFVGLFSCTNILRLALPPHIQFNPVAIEFGASFFNGAFWIFWGMLFSLHFMPVTPVRGVGSIVIASGMFSGGSLVFGRSGWTYDESGLSTGSSHYWDQESLAIALIVTTALLCALFIGYNVFTLKLSRNSLDVHLVQFKRQFRFLTRQVDDYKSQLFRKEKEREQLWRMLDLIALCRPMHRDHALAVALSEFQPENIHSSPSTVHLRTLSTMAQERKEASKPSTYTEELLYNRPKHQEAGIMHSYQQLLKLETPNHRELRLDDLLANPVTLELLKDAMAKNMDSESLMLYLDIQRFKTMENHKVRSFMAREIYDTFLATGARYEVNISHAVRKPFELRFAYDKGQLSPAAESAVPSDVFADVEREMRNLLQTNLMARLQATGTDQLCAQLITVLNKTSAATASRQSRSSHSHSKDGSGVPATPGGLRGRQISFSGRKAGGMHGPTSLQLPTGSASPARGSPGPSVTSSPRLGMSPLSAVRAVVQPTAVNGKALPHHGSPTVTSPSHNAARLVSTDVQRDNDTVQLTPVEFLGPNGEPRRHAFPGARGSIN